MRGGGGNRARARARRERSGARDIAGSRHRIGSCPSAQVRIARCADSAEAAKARTVLVGDNLPELGADLVAALAALDVNDLPHACVVGGNWRIQQTKAF